MTAAPSIERALHDQATAILRCLREEVIGTVSPAATLSTVDLPSLDRWTGGLDEGALAHVTYSVAGEILDSVIPLGDLDRIIAAGCELLDIGAPEPRPVAWVGVGWTGTRVVIAYDLRGFGQLVGSQAPRPDDKRGTFGDFLQVWSQRSGVTEVNERRLDAGRHLYREYGADEANRLIGGARAETIMGWYQQFSGWTVVSGGNVEAQSPPAEVSGTVAEKIVDALSIEAYGAARPHLPRARGWEQRYEVEPDAGKLNLAAQPTRYPNVTYEDADGNLGLRPWKGQILSEWTLSQLGPDPVGAMVAGLLDPTHRLSGALAHGMGSHATVQRWRDAGCTDRQVQVLYLNAIGTSQDESATALKIARSTVANCLSQARKKLSEPRRQNGREVPLGSCDEEVTP